MLGWRCVSYRQTYCIYQLKENRHSSLKTLGKSTYSTMEDVSLGRDGESCLDWPSSEHRLRANPMQYT